MYYFKLLRTSPKRRSTKIRVKLSGSFFTSKLYTRLFLYSSKPLNG